MTSTNGDGASREDVHELAPAGAVDSGDCRGGAGAFDGPSLADGCSQADEYDGDYDDDADAGPFDDYEPVPPFVFVGLATPEDPKGEPLKDEHGRPFPPSPRAVDGRGVSGVRGLETEPCS
jgi:hypothetical protein